MTSLSGYGFDDVLLASTELRTLPLLLVDTDRDQRRVTNELIAQGDGSDDVLAC